MKKIRLFVRADNSINRAIIPSQKSDFFIFGGITRDVWLETLPAAYIDNAHISTSQISKSEAKSDVEFRIVNSGPELPSDIKVDIYNANNKKIISTNVEVKLPPGESKHKVEMPTIANPALWSPDNPQLYTYKLTLVSKAGTDRVEERYGFRWFEFEKHGPFYLNGERLLLRGTHRHEEHAGLGNAMPDSLHRRDMEQIKEMGANFVRLAHYPQDPEVYRACDELGLLVWDELPWCRGGLGDDEWKSTTRRLLAEQIEQNYNHPSIIIWSLGNEIYWLPDYPDGGDIEPMKSFLSELNDLAHNLDPSRKTAIRKFYEGADIVDVFSPSIWAGWYSGVYKKYETAITKARDKYNHLLHVEYGGSSHVGRHTENPITGEGLVNENEWAEKPNMINMPKVSSAGDWSENYIVDLFDWHLSVTEQTDWFAGNAQWAFKDFGTPLRPENAIPYMNQKGLVDREGNPKDAFYVFKSYWTNNPKFCYIESPTWKLRYGLPGQAREVCVFSNCESVTLYLNDVALENRQRNIKEFPAAGLSWNVVFKEGENKLTAIGLEDEKEITRNEIKVYYVTEKPGTPDDLELTAKKMENGNYLVEARVRDKQGDLCYDFNERVYFDHQGPGRLKKYQGTPTGSDVIEFASGYAAIEYVPEGKGTATIEARTQDFKGSYVEIEF